MEIKIKCFGTFRNFGDEILINTPDSLPVSELRVLFYDALVKIDENFDDGKLLKRTRFATDTQVLHETDRIEKSMRLAIIPPVSGG